MKSNCVAVIFDLEYTAWEGSLARGWSGDDEDPEIIQIGAVELCVLDHTLFLGREFNRVVRPTLRPKLSAYITELTKITQRMLDEKGVSFSEALQDFFCFIPKTVLICSNGDDWLILDQNCEINEVKNPFRRRQFIDLRPTLAKHHGLPEDSEMLHSYRFSVTERNYIQVGANPGHDALVDAKAVAVQAIQIGLTNLPFDTNLEIRCD